MRGARGSMLGLGKKKKKQKETESTGWLTGQLLVAMPSMLDPRFEKTVLLMCAHGPEGAMGIVLNRLFGEISFQGLLTQLNVQIGPQTPEVPIHYGGPVDPVRGFVLHTTDYNRTGTTEITPTIALTATVEILQTIADGEGPQRSTLALGYAGWSPGQLETEIQANGWLTTPPDEDIIFDADMESKWSRALNKIGVSADMLVGDVGHA